METGAALRDFNRDGFVLLRDFFSSAELEPIASLVHDIDARWRERNPDPDLINSSYLTGSELCPREDERRRFFEFISRDDLTSLAEQLLGGAPYFLNTQLFFDPVNPEKKNYWHRDTQYLGLSEEEQKQVIHEAGVLHFRVALRPDPGLEFIAGSHARWDTETERDVRLELNGRENWNDLEHAVRVPHAQGDLLVFSAHIIHRGVYGGDRRSLDILYTDFPEKESMVRKFEHFPAAKLKRDLLHARIFEFVPGA